MQILHTNDVVDCRKISFISEVYIDDSKRAYYKIVVDGCLVTLNFYTVNKANESKGNLCEHTAL